MKRLTLWFHRSWSLLVVGATLLVAQAPVAPVATGTFLLPGPAGIEAEGRDWHATLGERGVVFIPALGDAAPQTMRLGWTLLDHGRSARRSPPPAAVPVAAAERVTYARGAMTEVYDVRPDGLELSLYFPTRPEGDGDLVVRYRVDTNLPLASARPDGIRWVGAAGGVQVGAVTGVAADGQRVAGALHLDGGVLSLSLPAAFVDTAAYPLVLDPLIGTVLSIGTGNVDSQPAGACEPVSGLYLVAFRRTFSLQQSLIRAHLVTAAGSPTGALIAVDGSPVTPAVSGQPSVAAVGGAFYVGWSNAVDHFLVPNVHAARVATNGAVSGATLLLPQEGEIDLASTPFTGLCTYTTANGIGFGGTGLLLWTGSGFLLQQTGTPYGDEIAVLSRGGDPPSPFVATNRGGQLFLQDASGALPEQVVTSVIAGHLQAAAVAMADASHGMVVWSQRQSAVNEQADVFARAFHWSGTPPVITFDTPAQPVAADPQRHESSPTVVWLGSKYGIAWQSADTQGHVDVLYRDAAVDCQGCGSLQQMNAATVLGFAPVLVGRQTGSGQPTGEALLLAMHTSGLLPSGGGIFRQPVTRFVGGPIVEAGPGCGFAGTFDTVGGPASLGNPDFSYRLTSYPAGGLTFFLLGFPGNELTCGLCAFVNPLVSEYVVPVSQTEARRPLPLPCVGAFLGTTLAAQWLVFGVGSTPCPAAPGLVASRRLHATLGM